MLKLNEILLWKQARNVLNTSLLPHLMKWNPSETHCVNVVNITE